MAIQNGPLIKNIKRNADDLRGKYYSYLLVFCTTRCVIIIIIICTAAELTRNRRGCSGGFFGWWLRWRWCGVMHPGSVDPLRPSTLIIPSPQPFPSLPRDETSATIFKAIGRSRDSS